MSLEEELTTLSKKYYINRERVVLLWRYEASKIANRYLSRGEGFCEPIRTTINIMDRYYRRNLNYNG